MSIIGAPIGAYPDSGDDTSLAQSAPSPVTIIQDNPTAQRIFLLVATPYDADTAGEVTKYVSSAPFVSQSGDSPSLEQFAERLINPYNSQNQLFASGNPISGSSIPGFGAISVANADGNLDGWVDLDWAGRTLKVYLGVVQDPPLAFSEFAQIAELKASGLNWDLDKVLIPIRDFRLLLEKPINDELYPGPADEVTGTDISFDAASGTINSTSTNLSGLSGYDYILVASSASNNGYFKIDSAAANTITVDESVKSVADESAGANVSINSALEGGEALKGKPKPRTWGRFFQFEPVLVEASEHIYQVDTQTLQAISAARDGGSELTFDADVADITLASPAASEYATCLATGHVRLGEDPESTFTVDGKGNAAGSLGYKEDVAGIIRKIVTEELSFTDPDDLETGAFSDIASDVTAPVGFTARLDQVDALPALDSVAGSAGCHVTFTRLGKLTVGRVTEPSGATEDFSITADDLRDPTSGQFSGKFAAIPTKRVRLGWKRYDKTLSPNDVLEAVDEDDRVDFGEEHRFVADSDSAVETRVPEAKTLEVRTRLAVESDASAEATRLLNLLSPTRHLYQAQLETGLFRYFLGDIIEVTRSRFDLASGKKFVVVGFTENVGEFSDSDEIVLTLWG